MTFIINISKFQSNLTKWVKGGEAVVWKKNIMVWLRIPHIDSGLGSNGKAPSSE